MIFVRFPQQLLQSANATSTAISQVVLTTAVGADQGLSGGEQTYDPFPPGAIRSAEVPALRLYNDAWWQSNAYQPWTLVEFGAMNPTSQDGKRDLGTEVLTDEALTGGTSEFNSSSDLSNSSYVDYWHGTYGGSRAGYSLLLAGNLLINELVLAMIAIGLLIAYLGLIVLWLAIPVLGLLVIIPGHGHEIASRLLQTAVALLALRVVFALLLVAIMILNESVIPAFVGSAWGLRMILQAVVVVVVFVFRRRLMAPVASVIHGRPVSAGGGEVRSASQAGQAAKSLIARRAMSLLGGSAGTAGAGGAAAEGAGAAAGAEAAAGGGIATAGGMAATVAAAAIPVVAPAVVVWGMGRAGYGDVKTMLGTPPKGGSPRLPRPPKDRPGGSSDGPGELPAVNASEPTPRLQAPPDDASLPWWMQPADAPPSNELAGAPGPPALTGDPPIVDAEWREIE
ncbi:MAG: hypothetical protein ACREQM_14190, partial [Candidatus Dormibacteraceae bacterium]